MKNKNLRLISYSASAGFLIANSVPGNTQVIYTDLEPDILLHDYSGNDIEFFIDFDHDGINEMQIIAADSIGSSGYDFYNWLSVSIQNYASLLAYGFAIKFLDKGDEIGESPDWNSEPEIDIENATLEYNLCLPDIENADLENKYIGVRFTSAGMQYYGWIRLGIGEVSNNELDPRFIIYDYAYNAVPDSLIIAGDKIPDGATHLLLIDSTETGSVPDLHFTAKHSLVESSIAEYRLILCKKEIPPSIISMEDAILLPPDRYESFIPNGTDLNYQFNELDKDVNGDPIVIGLAASSTYYATILNITSGLSDTLSYLSVPSSGESIQYSPTSKMCEISLADVDNNGNSSDFEVAFTPLKTYKNLEYRIYLTSEFSPEYVTATSLNAMNSTFYTSVAEDGSSIYSVCLQDNQNDELTGEGVIQNVNYSALVVAVSNDIYASYNAVSFSEKAQLDIVLGVEQTEMDHEIRYYDQQLIITTLNAELRFELVDVFGRKLLSHSLLPSENIIDINEFPSGFYIANIYSNNNQTSFQFVK